MSRADVYTHNESRWIPTEHPLSSEPMKLWSEPRDVIEGSSEVVSAFDTCYFYHNQAQLGEVRLYYIMEQLARLFLTSTHLTYPSPCTRTQMEADQKLDIWVDMPPLSTKKVMLRIQGIERGEPLAVLDLLPEE